MIFLVEFIKNYPCLVSFSQRSEMKEREEHSENPDPFPAIMYTTAIMSLSCGQTGTHANPYEQNTTHPAKLPGIRHQMHGWMMSKLPPSYIHLLSFSKIHEGFLGTICHAISVHLHKIFSNVST